jgi:hypothetical protein
VSEAAEVLPLPFQQLTELHIWRAKLPWPLILAMIADLPQLEILNVVNSIDIGLSAADAVPLSRLPKLRVIDLSGSQLCNDDRPMHPVQSRDQQWRLHVFVVQQLLHLQRALPHVEWVVDSLQH